MVEVEWGAVDVVGMVLWVDENRTAFGLVRGGFWCRGMTVRVSSRMASIACWNPRGFLTENMSTRMGFEDDPRGGEESCCARVGRLLYGVNRADDEALGRGSERDNLESTLRSSLTTS